jgi:hypothetical protein
MIGVGLFSFLDSQGLVWYLAHGLHFLGGLGEKKKDKPGIGSQEALTFNSNSAADLEALFHPFGA